MRRLVVLLAALACTGPACLADEAAVFLPTALAARLQGATRGGSGLALEVRPGGVLVTVHRALRALSPASDWAALAPGRCGDPAALEVPGAFTLPRELAAVRAASASPLEAVAKVVEYVSSRIAIAEYDTGPQDATAVLARGRGRCSGRANLAVGLLRAVGVPAHVVPGVLVGGNGARWHRWGEAWVGGPGWVAFDPGASVGLVSVRYLPVAGAGEGSPLTGVRLERIDERGYWALPLRSGMRVLPAGGVTVRCVAPARDASVTALLVAPDGSRWARRGRGQVSFEGMLPGRYRLVWRSGGRPAALDLELGDEREVRVDLPVAAEAGA